MALLLAPYNEGMRIGMGFNSYTQQLCTNDVVRLPGGVRASDKHLRKVEAQKGIAAEDSKARLLEGSTGTIVKKVADGQVDTSQVVSWKAGFVDNLSEVTDTLNISGALKIQIAAIGGGGSASAHYIDTTKFVKADLKYSINVDVMNQKLIAEDVTEFTPIPNVPASKFQEVYGNCYVSGFIEGGVLNALITRTQSDNTKLRDIGGQLSVNFDVKVAKIEGTASGGKVNEDKETLVKTDIMLSWSGGGDIKSDGITTWDMKSLSAVAMEFPDRVAACPQKTYAILTKYTSLRSFHEQTVKGSPLDYEIAGIYTSALLDAYVEYKAMWEDLHKTIKDLDRGTTRAKPRSSNNKLAEYGKLVAADYKIRMDRYNKFKEALEKTPGADSSMMEEPLPPNAVVPYGADAFGLDVAQRDCRFEMIKIVREVNEVTYDPKIAIDPNRNWRFLSPNVFKMLCPTDKEELPSPEQIAQWKSDLQTRWDKIVQQESDIKKLTNEQTKLTEEQTKLKAQVAQNASAEEQRRLEAAKTQLEADKKTHEYKVKGYDEMYSSLSREEFVLNNLPSSWHGKKVRFRLACLPKFVMEHYHEEFDWGPRDTARMTDEARPQDPKRVGFILEKANTSDLDSPWTITCAWDSNLRVQGGHDCATIKPRLNEKRHAQLWNISQIDSGTYKICNVLRCVQGWWTADSTESSGWIRQAGPRPDEPKRQLFLIEAI